MTTHWPTDARLPSSSDSPSCRQVGQTASSGSSAVSATVPMAADQNTVVSGASEMAILRVMISASAQEERAADAEQRGGLKAAQAQADDDQHPQHTGADGSPAAKADG